MNLNFGSNNGLQDEIAQLKQQMEAKSVEWDRKLDLILQRQEYILEKLSTGSNTVKNIGPALPPATPNPTPAKKKVGRPKKLFSYCQSTNMLTFKVQMSIKTI